MHTPSEWTNDQRNLLKELWPTAMPAAEIGTRCGGKSKGAVIGLANRMKLGSKKPFTQKIEAKANVRRPALTLVQPEPVLVSEPTVAIFIPENPVRFEDLEPGMCRWPIGDSTDETLTYCGCSSKGRPFCEEHEKVAYAPRRAKQGNKLPPLRTRYAFR